MTEPIAGMRLASLLAGLGAERSAVTQHALFAELRSLDDVRVFMAHHVFAVWDFMLLLKALQRSLSCVDAAWRPVGDARLRRLVNEIVLAEESDDNGRGGYQSHLELYLDAAQRVGADMAPMHDLLARLQGGADPARALQACGAPPAAQAFVRATLATLETRRLPAIAAAFAIGREQVLPDMFRQLVAGLAEHDPARLERLRFYLDRHIGLDGDEHGPAALRMLEALCAQDPASWRDAASSARAALRARNELWDRVRDQIACTTTHATAGAATPRMVR